MSSSLAGTLFVVALILALALVYRPLGDLLFRAATSSRHLASERLVYRLVGVDPERSRRGRSTRAAYSRSPRCRCSSSTRSSACRTICGSRWASPR